MRIEKNESPLHAFIEAPHMYKIEANENVTIFLFHCNGRFIASIYPLAVGKEYGAPLQCYE